MNKGVPGIIGMSGARWNLVWNDFIKNLSPEPYFEGELRHDLSRGRDFAGGGRIVYLVTHSLKRMKHKGREAHPGLLSVGAIVLACWSGPDF